MNELRIQGLTRRIDNNDIVHDLSFQVQQGEFFVLLGPSGSGKSITLRMISGIEPLDQGEIFLNDRNITHLPPRERNIGMVFQDYGLYPLMNVFDNMAYGLETQHLPRIEIKKRVYLAAEILGITTLLPRQINTLSGGEQQRIALARILVKDADLFLFDEPLSNLDPKLRYQARRDILTVHRTKGKPSIYVTHDQSEAFAIADRIAVISKGRLQQIGTSDDLLHNPENVFIARFVGFPTMNVILASIFYSDMTFLVSIEGIDIPLPDRWNTTLHTYKNEQVMLGIPPQAILLAGQYDPNDKEIYELKAEVLDAELQIGYIMATLKLGEHTIIQARFEEGEEPPPKVESWITIGINTQALKLFDANTERAIEAKE